MTLEDGFQGFKGLELPYLDPLDLWKNNELRKWISLPEFMNLNLLGKTILVVNIKFGLCSGHPLSQRGIQTSAFLSRALREHAQRCGQTSPAEHRIAPDIFGVLVRCTRGWRSAWFRDMF